MGVSKSLELVKEELEVKSGQFACDYFCCREFSSVRMFSDKPRFGEGFIFFLRWNFKRMKNNRVLKTKGRLRNIDRRVLKSVLKW